MESSSDSAFGYGLQHSGLVEIFVFLWWVEWKLRACCRLAAQEIVAGGRKFANPGDAAGCWWWA